MKRTRIRPLSVWYDLGIALFSGDGSERCLMCGLRQPPSLYVGRWHVYTDEGLPERWPVCGSQCAVELLKRFHIIRQIENGRYERID